MRGRLFASASLLGLLCSFVAPRVATAAEPAANAPPPSADQRARAQELFEKALADAQKGDFASACPKFRASQDVDPKTSTLLNLGSCYEQNGQLASAWGAFKEANVRAQSAGRADWLKMSGAHIAELEPKIAHITVLVSKEAEVPGLSITRDGAKVLAGERGVPLPADAGEHEFTASAEGKVSWSVKIKVSDAESARVTIPALADAPKPVPAPGAPPPVAAPGVPASSVVTAPPAAAPPPPYWTGWRIGGVAAAGVGLVGVAVGTVVGVSANDRYGSAKGQCQNGNLRACPAGAVSDAASARSTVDVATGVFVAGAALVVAGAGLFFLAPKPEQKTGFLRVAPSVLGMQGLVAEGAF